MGWKYPQASIVWIFPAGRGNCAFVRTGLNHGIIVDMASGYDKFNITGFIKNHFVPLLSKYPSGDDKGKKIAQGILSHPHTDHIQNCADLTGDLEPGYITCPHDKTDEERLNWGRINNPGDDKKVIESYKGLYNSRKPPLQSIKYDGNTSIKHLEYGIYYIRPPVCDGMHTDDNEYGNATSIMLYYRHGANTILFPGDVTPDGMKRVLNEGHGAEKRYTKFYDTGNVQTADWALTTTNQPPLKSLLSEHGLSVLVAPHHGLESCFSEELYRAIRSGKPDLVAISERRLTSPNDGETDARYMSKDGSNGMRVNHEGKDEVRNSVSTKAGHHIVILMNTGSNRPIVITHTNPFELLKQVKS